MVMEVCVLHRYHDPIPEELDLHHVFPVGMGGSKHGKTVAVCQTGHANTHVLLRAYVHHHGLPPWSERQHFGPTTRALAAEGWADYEASL